MLSSTYPRWLQRATAIGIVLAACTSAAIALDLGPKSFPLTVLGIRTEVVVTAAVDVRTEGDLLLAQVKPVSNLKDIQAKALDIARAIPVPKGNCDHHGINPVVNSIDDASITPSGDTAVITLKGHVTAWLCQPPLKTTLMSDSVELSAPVRIIVIDQKRLGLQLAAPVSVKPGSALTSDALRLLTGDVNAAVTAALTKALDATEAQASIPTLSGFEIAIESATFAADGPTLLIKGQGSAKMNSSAFNAFLNLMNR